MRQVRIREQNSGLGFELSETSGATFVFKNYIFPPTIWKKIEYLYDASGRRVQKIVDGTDGYWYIFDGYQMIEERTFKRSIPETTLRRQVVYGTAINEPVYVFDANANENYYLLKNDQNTVLALYKSSDTSGSAPREQYEYSGYGITNLLDTSGQVKTIDHDSNTNTPDVKQIKSDFLNPFGYQGMWRDEHTGLYHTHYRLYDPQHVRWLTPDPAGYRDGQNLYRFYAGPNGVDPLGLSEIGIHEQITLEAFSKAYGKFSWSEFMAPDSKRKATVQYVKEGLTEGVKSIDMPENFYTFLSVFQNPERYKNVKEGEKGYETYQTHFGKNQHLHFMAPDNMTPEKLKEKVIDDLLSFRKKAINALEGYKEGAKFSSEFSMTSGLGSDKEELKTAFMYIGKILHVMQDSFAQGHALRNDKNEIYMIQNYDKQYHGGLIEQAPGIGSSLHAQMDKIIPKMSIEMSSKLFSKLDNEAEFEKWLNDDVFKFAEGVKVEVPEMYTQELERIRDKAARLIQGSLKGYSDPNSFDPFGHKYDLWTR